MNKLIQVLLFFFCLSTTFLSARNVNDLVDRKTESVKDSLQNNKINYNESTISSKPVKTFRKFKSLEKFNVPISVKNTVKLNIKDGFQFNTVDSLQNKKWLDMANNVFSTVDKTQNYVDLLSDSSLGELPVAIRPTEISNVKYTVGIAKAVFKSEYTELTAFLKIETARGVLILGGSDIKLSHEGGIIGEAKLNLISQFSFNINNGKAVVVLNGSFEQPATYALIDCSGFKELKIDADLKFSNGLLYPVDENGKEKLGYVEGNFKTVVSDWNDIVVNISLPEFGIKGIKGTTFKFNTAIFDFSDLRNDAAMPQDYLSNHYNEAPELWRGVYINTLDVVLPKAFRKNNSDKRISFGASNLILDGKGVTGKFEGKNILTIDEGSASKWQFSLDRFLLEIETNSLKAGEFEGEFLLPVSKEDRLKYAAIIQPDEYSFRVTNTNEINFDVWSAKVTLTKDSYIEMKVKEDEFRPKANLNGSFDIKSGLKKSSSEDNTVNFRGIVFENMLLQTESPKFSVDYFGYKGNMSLANFPVTVNEIGLRTPSGDRLELVFDFNVNLTSESDGGNGGGAKLAIKAQLEDKDGRDKWRYDGIRLERLFVKMEVSGMELKGAIFIFEDDPTYGTGFAGAVGAKFSVGMNLEVEAKALFGRKEDFRYWFADAQVTLPQGIPIFTAFSINSFGGGFYNHMKMAGMAREKDAAFNHIGASTSGVIYEPYKENGFGLKATVGLITTGSEQLFHGSLEFGISFLKSGGLQEIYFKGEGEMISSLPGDFYEKLQDKLGVISKGNNPILPAYKPEGAMAANVFIKFDFVNDVFHATSELYINFGILKGVGPNGRAGWLDFYVGPDDWHLLIGTPDDPVGVVMDIGILKERNESYFMVGSDIPGNPPLPPEIVANILGIDVSKLDYSRDLNMLEAGKGLAFGSRWSMSTGDLRFLIFFARFDAGLGFDIMLKDYGEARCKGSSEQIGLSGWYANGQAYGYFQGHVGLKFKIFGKRKKITIFRGAAAALMQARLPNPVWVRGYIGGKYHVLGGLIKGKFRFKIELGEKCEIIDGSPLDGIVVIGDMTPKEGTGEVDVFAAPQVAFNMQINKVFEIPDDTGDNRYRILMDKFEVTKDGELIEGEIKWNRYNSLATFYSHEILPPKSQLKAYIQVHFEEYVNGVWEVIKDNGTVSTETKEVNFTTGTAPKKIPPHNIEFMYPVIGQQNFFIKEYDMGYVTLKRGQKYLFDQVPNFKKTTTILSKTGTVLLKDFNYNSAKKQIAFKLPENISTQTEYEIQYKLVPPENNDFDHVINEKYTSQNLESEGNEIEIKSNTLDQIAIKGEERELLKFNFRTSEYKTFDKKMSAVKKTDDLFDHFPYPYGVALTSRITPVEPFDITELQGTLQTGNKPLIVARAILDDSYYKKEIYPLLYEEYPLAGRFSVKRNIDEVSIPPVEGVEPLSWYLTSIENGVSIQKYNDFIPYRYNVTLYYLQDYEDLRYQLITSDLPWERMTQYSDLIVKPFPTMKKGNYKTKLQYVLPGQVKNGGSDIRKYYNPLYE